MIIRVFKATVPANLHGEFEAKFREVSVPLVKGYQGLHSLQIGKPTSWEPNDFVMISAWDSEESLVNFAGEDWSQAHIPSGMEQYISACTVSHFEQIVL